MKKSSGKKITPAFLLPVALGLGILLWPVCRYLEALTTARLARALLIVLTVLGTSTMISYMMPTSRFRSVLHGIGEFFYPLFLTALVPLLILDICYYFGIEVPPHKAVLALLAVFLPLTLLGLAEGIKLRVRRYRAEVKGAEPFTLVLLSDLHLGAFTPGGLGTELAEAIKKEAPDLVIIAGDLFDDRYDSLPGKRRERIRAGLSALAAAVPVYACEGNHDLLTADARKEALIADCGIHMLYDESLLFKGTRIVFRRDAKDERRASLTALLAQDGLPLIVADHNPFGHKEAWESGAALVLSGHTHAGQTFPGTLLYKNRFMRGYGCIREGERQLIVTSGAGIYGCPMRLGAAREIVRVEIVPAERA